MSTDVPSYDPWKTESPYEGEASHPINQSQEDIIRVCLTDAAVIEDKDRDCQPTGRTKVFPEYDVSSHNPAQDLLRQMMADVRRLVKHGVKIDEVSRRHFAEIIDAVLKD